MSARGHHGLLLAVESVPTTSYNTLVASYAPDDWWRLEETTGTTAAGSGSSGYNGALTGGATFADTGVSVPAPSGYAGLGRGVDFAVSGVSDIRITSASSPRPAFAQPPVSANPWTIVLTVAGSAGASQYLASRINNAAIIYQFVADTVEFFGIGYSGSDPRPGSQIPLDSSDTATPHQIVYRYDSGVWSGFKDGVQVFSVSRTFVTVGSFDFYLGSDSGTNGSNSKVWDYQGYNRALTDTEIADMWAARDAA